MGYKSIIWQILWNLGGIAINKGRVLEGYTFFLENYKEDSWFLIQEFYLGSFVLIAKDYAQCLIVDIRIQRIIKDHLKPRVLMIW